MQEPCNNKFLCHISVMQSGKVLGKNFTKLIDFGLNFTLSLMNCLLNTTFEVCH